MIDFFEMKILFVVLLLQFIQRLMVFFLKILNTTEEDEALLKMLKNKT